MSKKFSMKIFGSFQGFLIQQNSQDLYEVKK